MRTLALTLIALSVAVAGCFGGDDEETPPETTPTPSPTPTATPTATPTTGNGGTGNGTGGGATPTPAAPTPTEMDSGSFNFARPPPQAPTTETFSVPATPAYTTMTLNVTFSVEPASAPVAINNGVAITILSPGGASATCSPPATGPASNSECMATVAAEPGDWTVDFAGEGNWLADWVVIAS